ncbi:PD-(D/E)XK nuclease family protein [Ketobacter sp.]|uniref:PD-(D/E)XK nuclease family protein n=1 Tax=Ketobacter sp. TaxID=2083498 RepID=UPI0025C17A49|nr:PD-(D/E)XK nuclease family protein [Ketobacter sp.]
MKPFQEFAELFQILQAHSPRDLLVLTPNKRLSRFLRDGFNQYQATRQPATAWATPTCYSLQGWLQQAWEALALRPQHPLLQRMPLAPMQERILWQRVVAEHPETPPLLSTRATGNHAMEAWRLLRQWGLPVPTDGDSNGRIFAAWCDAFNRECEQRGVLSQAQVAEVVSACLQEGVLPAPATVLLYGFDEMTPQFQGLLQAMSAQGSQVEELDWQAQAQQSVRYEFSDEEAEIEAAALWAQARIQDNPQQRIAVVIPKLAQLREAVERIFTRVFEPQYILPGQPQHAPGFNISAGQPMDGVPVVAAALNVLALQRGLLDIEAVSQLLRSPFVGSSGELPERARLDRELRQGDLSLSLAQLLRELGRREGAAGAQYRFRCPDLYAALERLDQLRQSAPKQQRPSEWAPWFLQLLTVMGWPGQRTLDTLEFQQVQGWQEALQAFAGLDAVCGAIDGGTALQYLTVLLKHNSFQAQTKTSPIQILGVLEAAGLPFDHLWLMNMDDETWPPAPDPNPLLPLGFQIEHGMPQSSSQRELEYARRLLQRLSSSAPVVAYSHSRLQEDKQLRASTLVSEVPLQPFTLSAPESFAGQLFRQREIETSLESCGPKVVDAATIRGGTGILKDQAACPFRAFARHRLHADEMPLPAMGLDALERGNLLHKVMELIWRRLRHQQRLLELSEADLQDLIARCIEASLQAFAFRHSVGNRLLQIESQRLATQVRAFLELEKQRAPFSVVFNEGRKTVKLGKLPLNIRYDRVDRLEDGSLFVLDYKTGRQEIRYWEGERPDEPQVPLYCVANSGKVSGAAFGQITADEIALKGIAEDVSVAPGMKGPQALMQTDQPHTDQAQTEPPQAKATGDWAALVEHWRAVLEKLAQEFMAGAAAVDPKKAGVTCRYCEFKPLCRIQDQPVQHGSDDDGSDVGGERS